MNRKLLYILFYVFFLLSFNANSQWVTLNTAVSQNLNAVFFINNETGYACGVSGTIIKTTNGGTNWITLNPGSSVELRSVYFFNSSTGIVCGYTGTILRTTDGGGNWSVVNSGTSNQLLSISFFDGSNGVCVGNSGTTLYSTNGGLNWSVGQPTGYLVTFYTAQMVNTSTGYCGGVNTIFSPLFAKTTNSGSNWTYSAFYVNNNEATLRGIYFTDVNNGVAVSNLWNGQGGISKSTNGGANWSHQVFATAFYGVDFPAQNTGYIVGFSGAIMKSTDGGSNWLQQVSGTGAFLKSVYFIDSLTGFAAGDGGVILKTTNGGVTGIKPVSNEVPREFKLYQNYPNPFNPVTKIRFSLPLPSEGGVNDVSLVVYDVVGRQVASLIPRGQEGLSPGTYEVEFDGRNLPSGVYFYNLYAGEFNETKKMILLR